MLSTGQVKQPRIINIKMKQLRRWNHPLWNFRLIYENLSKNINQIRELKKEKLTSPNLDPQASLFPQKTQVSHKQGPSLPLHMVLQAWQHSTEELNLNSDPHFTAGPHSSKFSMPLQHSSFFSPKSPLATISKDSKLENWEPTLGFKKVETTA